MRAQQAFKTGLCSRAKKWLTCSQALECVRPMKPQPMTAMLRGLDMREPSPGKRVDSQESFSPSRACRARQSWPSKCSPRFRASSSRRWGTCSRPSRCGGSAWSTRPSRRAANSRRGAGFPACPGRRRAGSGGRSCHACRCHAPWRCSGRRGNRSSRAAGPRSTGSRPPPACLRSAS